MGIVTGTIVGTGQQVQIELNTARVPELTLFADLQDNDLVPGFDVSENQTRAMTLAMLRSKIIGDGTSQPPILTNGTIQLVVDATHAGTYRWDLPAIAGQDFKLERRSIGNLIAVEYDILSTGGFLLTGDSPKMREGEVIILTLVELEGGSTTIINNSGGMFTGIVTIDQSEAYGETHKRKVINISAGTNKVTYTLPDVTAVEENTIIPFETNGNNTYQSTIATVSGQLIYFNGGAYSAMYMGFGDILWLQAGEDGWYVIAMYGNFADVGKIEWGFKRSKNSLELNGQTLLRADWPRLWAEVSGYGASLITKAQWDMGPFWQGFFHTGDGSTTFGLPDVRGLFARFTDNGRGMDPDATDPLKRHGDVAGSYEADELKSHTHGYDPGDQVGGSDNNNDKQVMVPGGTQKQVYFTGGSETRPKNVNLTGYIKA